MSEVAGRMSVHAGAHYLEKNPWRARGSAVRCAGRGCGQGGYSRAAAWSGPMPRRLPSGWGADVTIVDKSLSRLTALDQQFGGPRAHDIRNRGARLKSMYWRRIWSSARFLSPALRAPRLVNKSTVFAYEKGCGGGGCRHRSGRLFLRPRMPRRIPTRFIWSMASCIIAWRICPARWREDFHFCAQ